MANFTDEEINRMLPGLPHGSGWILTQTAWVAEDVQEARAEVKKLKEKIRQYEKRFGPLSDVKLKVC